MLPTPEPTFYLVGGAVRDKLLGLEPKDLDYVVVGAPIWLLEARHFKRVGNSFPVFLHPDTGDEYAMARRERKVAPGYGGFEVDFGEDVTLEEDLSRRDLTINSMAMAADGTVIDPFDGQADLKAGILRHTTEAFSEDPLRVIRLARFVARYDFVVAPATIDLCKKMVASGELDHLQPDRIWAEFAKMLTESHFHEGIKFLYQVDCHMIDALFFIFKTMTPRYINSLLQDIKYKELTSDERAYYFTNITSLTKDEANAARIPVVLYRKLRLFSDVERVMLSSCSPGMVIDFFDKYRNDLHNGVMEDIVHFHYVNNVYSESRLQMFRNNISKLQSLDFAELIKGVPVKELKSFIYNTKFKALT